MRALTALLAAAALSYEPAYALGSDPPVYEFIVEGDTQDWATSQPLAWRETNAKACARKPAALIGTGDVVNFLGAQGQWLAARAAFDVLRACGLRYAAPAGNHDIERRDLVTLKMVRDWRAYDAFLAAQPQPALARAPSGHAWTMALAPGLVLGVLPYGPPAADVDWLIADLAKRSQQAVLVQHEAVNGWQAALPLSPAMQRVLAARGPQIAGVVGGHFLSADRVQFAPLVGGAPGAFKLFTNWQIGSLTTPNAFSGWVTVLEHRTATGDWCVRTENLITGESDRMEAPRCV
jgi:hypothetical protein